MSISEIVAKKRKIYISKWLIWGFINLFPSHRTKKSFLGSSFSFYKIMAYGY